MTLTDQTKPDRRVRHGLIEDWRDGVGILLLLLVAAFLAALFLCHVLLGLLAFALARMALPNAATHPHHAQFVRRVLGYMAAYYGLWAAADVIILSGYDAGWPVRLVPNQLYYGLFVPFVWWRFFSTPVR